MRNLFGASRRPAMQPLWQPIGIQPRTVLSNVLCVSLHSLDAIVRPRPFVQSNSSPSRRHLSAELQNNSVAIDREAPVLAPGSW